MRPDDALLARAQAARVELKAIYLAARAQGAKELADVAYRAYSEFVLPAFTGEENTRGVQTSAVRR